MTWSAVAPTAPSPFTAINAGEDQSCGLRADGSTGCWGEPLTVSPPRNVQFV